MIPANRLSSGKPKCLAVAEIERELRDRGTDAGRCVPRELRHIELSRLHK